MALYPMGVSRLDDEDSQIDVKGTNGLEIEPRSLECDSSDAV